MRCSTVSAGGLSRPAEGFSRSCFSDGLFLATRSAGFSCWAPPRSLRCSLSRPQHLQRCVPKFRPRSILRPSASSSLCKNFIASSGFRAVALRSPSSGLHSEPCTSDATKRPVVARIGNSMRGLCATQPRVRHETGHLTCTNPSWTCSAVRTRCAETGTQEDVMWRLAVLVSALTVIPSLAVAQQPCTTDARQVIEQVYRQVLERSADPGASVWVDR